MDQFKVGGPVVAGAFLVSFGRSQVRREIGERLEFRSAMRGRERARDDSMRRPERPFVSPPRRRPRVD